MSTKAIPVIAAAGALLLLSSNKRKSKPSSKEGAVDESNLDDKSKTEQGDFETEDEDISFGEDEEGLGEERAPDIDIDSEKTCEEFMAAVHVVPETGELPINEVAVEQTVLPAMRKAAEGIIKNLGGPLDEEEVGPILVLEGLKALVPVCEWEYNPKEDEFTYDEGQGINSQVAQDVLFGLINISVGVIENANKSGLEAQKGVANTAKLNMQ